MPTPSSHPIPPGMPTLTPHLICANAVSAIDFYTQAFGAQLLSKMMTPDGRKLMHAMMKIGDSPLMLADEHPEWGVLGPQAGQPKVTVIHIYVTDVDAAIERAAAAGAKVVMPAADMFWGDRYGQVDDPYGHRWSLATHKFEMTPEEMQEEMQQAMKQQPCGS